MFGSSSPPSRSPFVCLKSSNNYGRIAQRTLAYAEYRDATCSGAETEDMTQPQNVSPGPNPPQFGAAAPQPARHEGDGGHGGRSGALMITAS